MDGFELTWLGTLVSLPSGSQRVIAYLGLHDHPLARSRVAEALWPETGDARALANLRSALWRIRRVGRGIVDAWRGELAISAGTQIDIRGLRSTARAAIRATEDLSPGSIDSLVACGEVLAGWFDDWAIAERERFRQLRLHALEHMCLVLATAGEFGRAIDLGLTAVSEEPLRESAHEALTTAHLIEGNRGDALRQFEAYRQVMRDELGLDPNERMVRLVSGAGLSGHPVAADATHPASDHEVVDVAPASPHDGTRVDGLVSWMTSMRTPSAR